MNIQAGMLININKYRTLDHLKTMYKTLGFRWLIQAQCLVSGTV